MKCTCGKSDCPIEINFDTQAILFTGKDGTETLMYVDANTVIKIISQLRKMLDNMVRPDIRVD